jgi:hypothetical protein
LRVAAAAAGPEVVRRKPVAGISRGHQSSRAESPVQAGDLGSCGVIVIHSRRPFSCTWFGVADDGSRAGAGPCAPPHREGGANRRRGGVVLQDAPGAGLPGSGYALNAVFGADHSGPPS